MLQVISSSLVRACSSNPAYWCGGLTDYEHLTQRIDSHVITKLMNHFCSGCRRFPIASCSTTLRSQESAGEGRAITTPAHHMPVSIRAELEEVKMIVWQNSRLLNSIMNHLMAEEDEEELLVRPFNSLEQLEEFLKKMERPSFRKKVVRL